MRSEINKKIIEIENMIEVDMRNVKNLLLEEKYRLEYEYHALNNRAENINNRIIEIENYLEGAYRDEIEALHEERYELYIQLEEMKGGR